MKKQLHYFLLITNAMKINELHTGIKFLAKPVVPIYTMPICNNKYISGSSQFAIICIFLGLNYNTLFGQFLQWIFPGYSE